MKSLLNVTLIGVDCIDLKRLQIAADISSKEISFGAVKLLSSIESNDKRVIKINPIESTEEYSDFMIKDLYKYVDTEFAIVFQYDGFILNPNAWADEFLKYDYIGAPWYHLGDLHVGNGGFSLRSKRLINWLAHNWQDVGVRIHPEDIFISRFVRPLVEEKGMIYAPEEVASRFAKEGNRHSVVWNGEFGFHGIKYTDISNWLNHHSEYKKVLTYKLDDYATLMKKYPVYNGNVYTFDFGKYDLKNYKKLAENKKDYEIRPTNGKYHDLGLIKSGNILVFKRSGVSFQDFPVPAFERKIKKVERFDSLKELRKKYPNLLISPPHHFVKKWQLSFARFLGDFLCPRNISYSIFWF